MSIFREIRKPAIFVTLVLFIAVAVLIVFLASQVTKFSKKVTDFYAPTIYAVKDFEAATSHMKMSLEGNELPEDTVIFHFRSALANLRDVTDHWDPAYRAHLDNILKRADNLSLHIKEKHTFKDMLLSEATQLNNEAMQQVAIHESELKIARDKINKLVLTTRIVAIFLLLIGIFLSFRELQIYRLQALEQEKLSAIKAFVSALDARDPYTKGHSERVADYSKAIAKEMELKKEFIERLYLAALMHDMGKIAVDDTILRKEKNLTDEEWKIMRIHPVATARILRDFKTLKDIVPWALYHHERFDGKGYPEGKAGMDIPLPAQILAVADAFDAMTSKRPYRPGMNLETALLEIEKNKGLQWRPDVVDAFMRYLRKGIVKLPD